MKDNKVQKIRAVLCSMCEMSNCYNDCVEGTDSRACTTNKSALEEILKIICEKDEQ